MAFEEEFVNVQVLYQLSWEGKMEHPHMITVQYPSHQDGLRLRDVKKRLTTLRGQGIGHTFSWSYKRNYRNTFIWNDLGDDDVIHPLRGSGEYLLKGSELIDTFASMPAENPSQFQNERKQSPLTPQMLKGCDLDGSSKAVDRHARTMSVDDLALRSGGSKKEVDIAKGGVAIDILQSLPPLSVEQETIDVEKYDFCLSSSDNEISPRPLKMADSKPVKEHGNLVVLTMSSTVQGPQTPPSDSLTSPTDVPFSPGSAKRMWKREIRKSLFRTRNSNVSSPSSKRQDSAVCENATLQEQASLVESSGHEDASLWKSKSVNTAGFNETKEKEKEVEQSTSQLIRLLWARWTGGSSKSKRIPNNASEVSCKATKTPESTPNSHSELSHAKSPCKEEEEISAQEEIVAPCPAPKAVTFTENALPRTSEAEKEIASVETPSQESQKELRMNRPVLIVPELQVVLDSAETDAHEGGPPEADIETPKPAIASPDYKSVNNSNGLSKIRTVTSPRPLPPGFHKGTNDTKPMQTPRRSARNTTPLASPPLRRSFSRDAARSLAITSSPEQDSLTSTPSPQKPINQVKKCINFRERDERPLTPGLTALDWEKALQAAVADCLPPPNFRQILQECSTCGRTFKPDSLQVHMRGCHPPQYARAFSARASPHMVRSRAT